MKLLEKSNKQLDTAGNLLNISRLTVLAFVLVTLFPFTCLSEVNKVVVDSKEVILNGKEFGDYGSYELIKGKIFFIFDPANEMNSQIVDLKLATRNDDGYVEAWANFVVLKPVDNGKSRGIALVEVSNRGGKFSPRYFNRAKNSRLDPNDPDSFGDFLLMESGLTVIWVGWEFDVPRRGEMLFLEVPKALNIDGSTIYGLVRSDWTVDRETRTLGLGHRNQIAYPVADPNSPENVLTVRDGRDQPRDIVPRENWKFAREENDSVFPSDSYIYMEDGFEEGKLYELVYLSKDPPVVGLGLAVIRDIISYAKYDKSSLFPVKYGIAAGVSQTGRFLRHFIYQNFNTDEKGRKAYDGCMIITAGAGRGSFNHRFAQPSRDAHRYSAFFYPTDIFPFTSQTQLDPEQWKADGLFAHITFKEHIPRVFYINTGYEYWGRAASLIHTSIDGMQDVEPLDNERIYHLASGQHFVGRFPPSMNSKMGEENIYRGNPLDFSVNYRALLIKLADWISDGSLPPPNAYPKISEGTLVPISNIGFPAITGLLSPEKIHVAYLADYGPRWTEGIVDFQPPLLTKPFISLASQLDSIGNEIAGVRNLELRVPLATYLPWNIRVGYKGGSDELYDFLGTYIPLPITEEEKEETGDTRPSINSLYLSDSEYSVKVTTVINDLVKEGFVLSRDTKYIQDKANLYWEWITKEQGKEKE